MNDKDLRGRKVGMEAIENYMLTREVYARGSR